MAREYGIDLRQVKGTGAGGRITKQDLEAYMSAQGARTMAQSSTPAPAAAPLRLPPPRRAHRTHRLPAASSAACRARETAARPRRADEHDARRRSPST